MIVPAGRAAWKEKGSSAESVGHGWSPDDRRVPVASGSVFSGAFPLPPVIQAPHRTALFLTFPSLVACQEAEHLGKKTGTAFYGAQLTHRFRGDFRAGKTAAPSGSGSRNGTGFAPCAISLCLCHRSLTASGPTKFTGLGSVCDEGDRVGPSNLGGLRPKVKRPMATATGMAPGDFQEPCFR